MGKGGSSVVFNIGGGSGGAPWLAIAGQGGPPFSLFLSCALLYDVITKKGNGDQDNVVQGRGGISSFFLQFLISVIWCFCSKEDLEKIKKNLDKKVTSSSYRKLIGFADIFKRKIF